MSDAFHELFEINDLGNSINLPVADTYVKWQSITEGVSGPSDLTTFDAGNNQLLVGPKGEGLFSIFLSCDFGGSTNTTFTFAVFVNGIRQTRLQFGDLVRPPDDRMAGEVFGGRTMVPGDIVDVRFAADKAPRTLVLFRVKLYLIGAIRVP